MNINLLKIIIITLWDATKFMIMLPFKGKNLYYQHSRQWSKRLLKAAKINVKVSGEYNFDKTKSYIFVTNHSSLLDIPVILGNIDLDCRIIYKKELEKIPVFGKALSLSPFIKIDRDNAKNAIESLKQAIEAVKTGESVLIFPEGTRSEDGRIVEFKRGAVMLAIKSGKPIIPVCIKGAFEMMPARSSKLKSGVIEIVFGNPVLFEEGMSKKEELEKLNQLKTWLVEKLGKN